MYNFTTFLLNEELLSGSIDKAMHIIGKYLKRKTGVTFFRYPGIEKYKGGGGRGFGVRFYSAKGGKSVRFNWVNASPNASGLDSITIWPGGGAKGYTIKWEKSISLVKSIPAVADALNNWGGSPPKVVYSMPDDVSLKESLVNEPDILALNEAAGAFDPDAMFNDIVDMVVSPNFTKSQIYKKYKSAGFKVFDAILTGPYGKEVLKVGTKYKWTGDAKTIQLLKKTKDDVLTTAGVVAGKVTNAGAESYEGAGNIEAIINDRERLSFEAQLEDLENLLKLTISGAANALFVAGRGGVGKTFTTEKILHSMGLQDGNGYFKNTGSASTAGIYALLFKYKDSIVFFDDSDDALKDQGSRNLLKAATDTKKVRKLVWNKMGKNIVDPDEDMTDEEILEAGLLPRYFEFTGKIIFISNLKLDKLDPDGALRTRSFIVDIDPTEMEIYDFMEKIVGKIQLEDGLDLDQKERMRVVSLLRKGTSKQTANLRKLSRGLNMAAGALKAGVSLSSNELSRMIQTYA
jgi:hypothetical protein